ncbi:transcriptional regulator, TetR family [Jatrophihabitans endophyticus]|uniref:Transcriptional regulator, TetR family n=1 Tax=Jatrophihabitans endophyticus TaxID=1206085 RepID=A0A1M5KIL7_9ACTN|nr:TetR family transcriptional regulator [Jatrophihabitans endophyticus]SHG52686.1 transcriptional regulator, TetR family [Jatrophihabitans endophyticus]
MGRWEPNARERLAGAALELYAEHGFDKTTVAEIAQRAGLTERTFFRHFADKREVLFGGQEDFNRAFVAGVAAAPAGAAPLDAVAVALAAAPTVLPETRRPHARARALVIARDPALRERELIKLASLSSVIAAALRERGVAEPAASLTAEAGVAVFKVAFARWVAEPDPADTGDIADLAGLLRDALAELRAVMAGGTSG